MQHYGAPTRLLAWTYSLHVATHFALSHAKRNIDTDMAIWMVDTLRCVKASQIVSGLDESCGLGTHPISSSKERKASRRLLDPNLPLSVWPLNPFRLDERLTIQKGVFLAAGDPTKEFAQNLAALSGYDDDSNLCRFVIPRSEARAVGRELYDANVTEATLFPGLDGFARSLWLSSPYLSLEGMSLDVI
jgi:hypothetical protein